MTRDGNELFPAVSISFYDTEENWPLLRVCCTTFGMEKIDTIRNKVTSPWLYVRFEYTWLYVRFECYVLQCFTMILKVEFNPTVNTLYKYRYISNMSYS